MLTLNILHLLKSKKIPIKYNLKVSSNYSKTKYIYNKFTSSIIELFNLLNSLSIAYLYLQKYISLKQKILFSTNHTCIVKSIATLTSNYYIYNNSIYYGMISNWIFLKRKLMIYKWLKYFFTSKLADTNNYKDTIYVHHTLYFLYLKLKLRYHGLKNLNTLPYTFLYINLTNNNLLRETIKLNRNIIVITTNMLKIFSPTNIIQIITTTNNTIILHFILEILTTSILHGMLI